MGVVRVRQTLRILLLGLIHTRASISASNCLIGGLNSLLWELPSTTITTIISNQGYAYHGISEQVTNEKVVQREHGSTSNLSILLSKTQALCTNFSGGLLCALCTCLLKSSPACSLCQCIAMHLQDISLHNANVCSNTHRLAHGQSCLETSSLGHVFTKALKR